MPAGTAKTATPRPMITLLAKPRMSLSSAARAPNHSTEKHSNGVTRGNAELLNAVTPITSNGPKR